MKSLFRITSFSPGYLKRCGLDPVSAAISGGLGLAGNIVGGVSASNNVDATNQTNKEIAEQTNALNYQMFQESNQFNANQAQLNRDFQQSESEKNREYNSIGAQADRAKEAGFNPAMLAGSPTPVTNQPSGSAAVSSGLPHLMYPEMRSKAEVLSKLGSEFGNSLGQLIPSVASAMDKYQDARGKKIENDRKEYEDKKYNNYSLYIDPQTGTILTEEQFNALPDNEKVLANTHLSFKNRGEYEAYLNLARIPSFANEQEANNLKSQLQKRVNKTQLESDQVVLAIAEAPLQERKRIDQLISESSERINEIKSHKDLLDSQKLLLDLEKKLKEETNLITYIDKISDGDFGLQDFAKVILLLALMRMNN